MKKLNGSTIDLSSDSSEEEVDILPEDSSVYVSTEKLMRALHKAKIARNDAHTREEDKDYTWKISVIKHRRFK